MKIILKKALLVAFFIFSFNPELSAAEPLDVEITQDQLVDFWKEEFKNHMLAVSEDNGVINFKSTGHFLTVMPKELTFPVEFSLKEGENFHDNSGIYGTIFTLSKIEKDGVVIKYESHGGCDLFYGKLNRKPCASGKYSRMDQGEIKLGWKKQAPAPNAEQWKYMFEKHVYEMTCDPKENKVNISSDGTFAKELHKERSYEMKLGLADDFFWSDKHANTRFIVKEIQDDGVLFKYLASFSYVDRNDSVYKSSVEPGEFKVRWKAPLSNILTFTVDHPDKKQFKIGDNLTNDVILKNVSDKDVWASWFVTGACDLFLYPKIKNMKTQKEEFYFPMAVAHANLIKNQKISAGEEIRFHPCRSVKIVKILPTHLELFWAPSPGQYEIFYEKEISVFNEPPLDDLKILAGNEREPIWRGKIKSEPVVIEVGE